MESKKANNKLRMSSEKLLELDDKLQHFKTLDINELRMSRPIIVKYIDGKLKFEEFVSKNNNSKNNNSKNSTNNDINNITSHALNILFPLTEEQQNKLLSDIDILKYLERDEPIILALNKNGELDALKYIKNNKQTTKTVKKWSSIVNNDEDNNMSYYLSIANEILGNVSDENIATSVEPELREFEVYAEGLLNPDKSVNNTTSTLSTSSTSSLLPSYLSLLSNQRRKSRRITKKNGNNANKANKANKANNAINKLNNSNGKQLFKKFLKILYGLFKKYLKEDEIYNRYAVNGKIPYKNFMKYAGELQKSNTNVYVGPMSMAAIGPTEEWLYQYLSKFGPICDKLIQKINDGIFRVFAKILITHANNKGNDLAWAIMEKPKTYNSMLTTVSQFSTPIKSSTSIINQTPKNVSTAKALLKLNTIRLKYVAKLFELLKKYV